MPIRFRPGLGPTLFTIPCLILLVYLGVWQLQRRDEKAALIQRVEHGLQQPPVPLPAVIDDPEAWDYRPVRVTGRYLHDREIHLLGRTDNGQPGLHVITPLQRADGAGTVLVNRGWVPLERRASGSRPDSLPAGRVTVQAIARAPANEADWWTPENDLDLNDWFWVDVSAMAAFAGISETVQPVYLEVGVDPDPDALPVAGQTRIDFPNNHLQYALTWFGLAVALMVVYGVSQAQRRHPDP